MQLVRLLFMSFRWMKLELGKLLVSKGLIDLELVRMLELLGFLGCVLLVSKEMSEAKESALILESFPS